MGRGEGADLRTARDCESPGTSFGMSVSKPSLPSTISGKTVVGLIVVTQV